MGVRGYGSEGIAGISIKPKPDFEQLRKTLLRDGKPEYVPFYELFVNHDVIEKILGKPVPNRAATLDFYYKAGYDYLPVWPWLSLPMGSLIDRRGGYPIKDWQTFDSYPWPDPGSVSYQEFETIAPMLPDGMMMIGQTGGIFEAAEGLLGYEQLCYLLLDDRPLVEAVFERIGALYEVIYRGMAQIEKVGALVISDDLGFKTQTLIGADDMRKLVLPLHARLAQIIHEAGKPCILHSCGQLVEIMEDIIEKVRIDAKHSYEDAILPVTEASKLYGNRIAILGGFDVDRLCRYSEDEVRKYTRMLLDELGSTGGYALGSGNSIPGYIPTENYLAMIDEGWKARGT